MKSIIKKIYIKLYPHIKKILFNLFKILPINKDKIVFMNFNGKGYGCNPKYIAEEFLNRQTKYKLYWLVNDLNEELPKNINKVQKGDLISFYHLSTAKIWINNVRNDIGISKKKNQFYLQTWHGTMGLKKIEGEVENLLSEQYIKDAKNDGRITNLMISSNSYFTNKIKKYFWYDGEILECGEPRNATILKKKEVCKKIYDYYGIPKNKKIALYVPTFRNKFSKDDYIFDFKNIRKALEHKFNEDFIIMIRLHPNVSNLNYLFQTNDSSTINVTFYPDVQELIEVSEIIISDYSSCLFEKIGSYKKGFIIAKDFENYINNERGIDSVLLDYLPFSVSKNENEFVENILKFDENKYIDKCNLYMNYINYFDKGNGAIEVVDRLEKELKK